VPKHKAYVLITVDCGIATYETIGNVEVALLDYDLLDYGDEDCLVDFINSAEGISQEFLAVLSKAQRDGIHEMIKEAKEKLEDV
jgi:hypothetical protein